MEQRRPAVILRPAAPDEMPFITHHIHEFLLDDDDLDYRQFLVAADQGVIVGFGRIRPHKEVFELGGVGVVGHRRNEGIGRMIIRHLVDIFTSDTVHITTDILAYFERPGLKVVADAPRELVEKIERVCTTKCREGGVVMVFDRTGGKQVSPFASSSYNGYESRVTRRRSSCDHVENRSRPFRCRLCRPSYAHIQRSRPVQQNKRYHPV